MNENNQEGTKERNGGARPEKNYRGADRKGAGEGVYRLRPRPDRHVERRRWTLIQPDSRL